MKPEAKDLFIMFRIGDKFHQAVLSQEHKKIIFEALSYWNNDKIPVLEQVFCELEVNNEN
jgi:hypothetical protein